MHITDIQENWRVDSQIDRDNIDSEALAVDSLQYKYANILYDVNTDVIRLSREINMLFVERTEHYKGKGKNKPPQLLPLKAEVPDYVNADTIYLDKLGELGEAKARYKYVESILWALVKRYQNITNFIQSKKLTMGV
jgi:phage host-nuclease inhibitor protein Gam